MTEQQTTLDEFSRVECVLRKLKEMERQNAGDFSFSPREYSRGEVVLHLWGDDRWCEMARAVLRTHGFTREHSRGVVEEWRRE